MKQQPEECITPRAHAVMVPYPAQGHVIPLMKLARILASDRHGFEVTFVNTDFVHARISKAAAAENGLTTAGSGRIRLVSVPDGLGPDENRNDLGVTMKALKEVMSVALEQLIRRLAREGREPTCMIADVAVGWAVDVGARMGVPTGVFCLASAALQAMFASVPRLIQEGYIAADGNI